MNRISTFAFAVALLVVAAPKGSAELRKHPLKVFILAGQSNMQGHANVSTMPSMAEDSATRNLYQEMVGEDGRPLVCQDVWISSVGCAGDGYADVIEQTGKLTAGFGASPREIGPEFSFGLTMEKALHEPILIIKTSWGGRSLMTDFRPPSARPRVFSASIQARWKERKLDPSQEEEKSRAASGVFYQHMIDHIRMVLANIARVVPGYDARQGYDLAGFVWFQGFNDMIDDWSYPDRMRSGGYGEYSALLADLIRDVRHDLNAPKLPVVIGVMGIDGLTQGAKPPQGNFRMAQASVAALPEFKNQVVAVETARFWDDHLGELQARREKVNARLDQEFKKEPTLAEERRRERRDLAMAAEFSLAERHQLDGISNGGYHYLGAAKILAPIGETFARALLLLRGRA